METKRSIAVWLLVAAGVLPAIDLYGAEPAAKSGDRDDQAKPLNSPLAAEPVKPGTLDKPLQPVAPGTLDAPPKPIAPGTLDKNVINPDVEIRKGEKPIPR